MHSLKAACVACDPAPRPSRDQARADKAVLCRVLTAVLVAALLGVATVAFTGVPGYVQPGFERIKTAAATQQVSPAPPVYWRLMHVQLGKAVPL